MPTCPECGHRFAHEIAGEPGALGCPQCGSPRWAVQAFVEQVDTLDAERIPAVELTAPDKEQAIGQLVAAAALQGGIDSSQQAAIHDAIMQREALGPTGIGRGCAFPHARWEQCQAVSVAIGFSKEGIEYESLDGRPVHIIVLVISPADDPAVHLRTLEGISRNLRSLL